MISGREQELKLLSKLKDSDKAELLVLYGRRRIGKSALIKSFCQKEHALLFEGIESEGTAAQIEHFSTRLRQQVRDPILTGTKFSDWDAIFSYLTSYLARQSDKVILFFDEFQWQAANQTKLVALLKFYWDNEWKAHKPLLILCGSIGSFMVRKVLKSKALYGRATAEMHLRGLDISSAKKMLRSLRSDEEILLYQMIFGGVPKYLEDVDTSRSFSQNLDHLCFSENGVMVNEIDRIFASQFREATTYQRIVRCLLNEPLNLNQISKKIKMASGGGLKVYLENLILSDMVESVVSLGRKENSKDRRYQLSDEYLIFFFKYVEPHLKLIRKGAGKRPFERLVATKWKPWLGLCFEHFCQKNALALAKIMGFDDRVLEFGPVLEKGTPGFQIDLAFLRTDQTVTICEIKFLDRPIDASVIAETDRRCKLFHAPRGHTVERALISLHGPDSSLRKANWFHHFVELKDLLKISL